MGKSEFIPQTDGDVGLVEPVDKDIFALDVEVEPLRKIHLETGTGIDAEFVDGVGQLLVGLQTAAPPALEGDTGQRIEREAAGKGYQVVNVAVYLEVVAVVIRKGVVDRGGYPPVSGNGQVDEDTPLSIFAFEQVSGRYTQAFGVVGLGLCTRYGEQHDCR